MMTVAAEITRVTEDYLTLIWKANEWPDDNRRPTTGDLAESLGVTLSTVSANLKRLARERLIDYEPYGTIALTEEGAKVALEVVRRHRIIETFLVEHLGVPWDEVHDEADRLEHATSDRLIARMDALLGHPATDPHGGPIPRDGVREPVAARVLTSCATGELVRVIRASDANPDILRFLAEHQVGIGTVLRVTAAMSATGLMTVRRDDTAIELSAPIAMALHVAPAVRD